MKTWPDARSPWGKRLYFEDSEFEVMMDELRTKAGDCFRTGAGVDVDRVLLGGLGIEADYTDLPPGIMGRTRFPSDGKVYIEVDRRLSDEAERDATARRRLRTTLAHECGHVACHARLYAQDRETLSLFPEGAIPEEPEREPIMCRHETEGTHGYSGEWWELQANRCMAALLMPRDLLVTSVRRRLDARSLRSVEDAVRMGECETIVRELASEFDVNPVVALRRLDALGYLPAGEQRRLRLME